MMIDKTRYSKTMGTKHKILAFLFVLFIFLPLKEAFASCPGGCGCPNTRRDNTLALITNEHVTTNDFIVDQFQLHQNWFFGANGAAVSFFHNSILPAMMMMTEQLVSVGMAQMLILGAYFDADITLDTQRLLQRKMAEAHKDYHPSYGMCVIGTNTRSLSAAERLGGFAAHSLSQFALERQLGNRSAGSSYGSENELRGRLRQFISRYCDIRDNNDGYEELCTTSASNRTVNKDIDYTRTVDSVSTLNINFTDGTLSSDEQDIIALTNNLFSSTTLDWPEVDAAGREFIENPMLKIRALAAKRNVIQHSFNNVIGLKARGSDDSQTMLDFSQRMLEQMGITSLQDRRRLLSGTTNGSIPTRRPSYYSQMQLLARTLYQSPDFFTDLYDKPANVARKDVAMQAIGLMLNRDMFESELRSEMVLSIMLESELLNYQRDLQDRLNALAE